MINVNKTPADPTSSSNYVYGISYDKKYFQIGVVLENSSNKNTFEDLNNLSINNVLAGSGAGNYFSRIKGNYLGLIKYSTGTSSNKTYYIANIPSLLYNNDNPNLLSTGTYYIVNNNTNLPYQIDSTTTTNNKTADIIIQDITNSTSATLTGVDITSIVTNTGGTQNQQTLINNLFSGTTLSSFGGNIGVVSSIISNGTVTTSSTTTTTSTNDCVVGSYSGASTQTYTLTSTLNNTLSITGTTNIAISNGNRAYSATLTCNTGSITINNESVVNNCNSLYSWGGGSCVLNSCGTSNGQTFATTPSANFCSGGNASSVTYDLGLGQYSWTCGGTASCIAYDNNNSLMLHFDGNLNNSGSNAGVASNVGGVTFAGSGVSGSSAYFNGSDYLTIPDSNDWYFATGNFTIDFWYKPMTATGIAMFWAQDSGGNDGIGFAYNYANGMNITGYAAGAYTILYGESNISLTSGQWYHIALVRNGTNFSIYRNGTRVVNTTDVDPIVNVPSSVYIGASAFNPAVYRFNGYLDEYRVSKVARWTGASFTTPTTY